MTSDQRAFIHQKIAEITMCLEDPWHSDADRKRRRALIARAEKLLLGAGGVPPISQAALR